MTNLLGDLLEHYGEGSLSIADVVFTFRPERCFTRDHDHEPYVPFTASSSANSKGQNQILVRVNTGMPPDTRDLVPLFESGEAWAMSASERGYVLAFWRGLGPSREQHTVVESDRSTTEVTVWRRPLFRERAGEIAESSNPVRYPLDQLLLMNHLAHRGGVIIHAAGMVLDGAGLVFPGVSRAGKSTMARLFQEHEPDARLLSDDRIIVRRKEEAFRAYGTPWPGDAGIAANESTDLHGLLFLTKASQNRINLLSPSEATRRLFPVVSCPWYDRERLPGVLETCELLVTEIPCFELQFSPAPAVVSMLGNFVMRELAP
jgi:hypothetical protein